MGKGAAIALGNFDGLHAGHRAVIESARQAAFSLIASSIETVIVSFDRSSPTMLVPPETRSTIGTSVVGSTDVLWTPLVSMRESASGKSGAMVLLGTSRRSVGPRK